MLASVLQAASSAARPVADYARPRRSIVPAQDIVVPRDPKPRDLQAVALATSEKRRRTSYLTCPISTGLLVNPLKARPCGHVYSKASAMAYFKGVGKKCAIFGCDKHLKWSDFVVDEASEGALREYYRRQARTRQDADGHPYGQLM